MGEDQNRIVEILVKYALYEPLTEEETRLLEDWRARSTGHDELPEQLRDPGWIAEHRRLLHPDAAAVVPVGAASRYRIGWRKPVWAVLCVLVVVGGWMLMGRRGSGVAGGVVPAGVQAYLTSSESGVVVLDTVAVGGVVDGAALKEDEHTLSYVHYKGAVVEQRLTVAPGAGPFRILLGDGSRVVLNGASSLEYASDLRAGRAVLDGEAWFGVARDVSRPLTVGLDGGVEVSVLGTTFDVSTARGGSRVLLYSGALRVRKGADSVVLRPGQAAVFGGPSRLVERVMGDSERMLAWRGEYAEEDVFVFENASLSVVLKAVGEWYGVAMSNPSTIQGVAITGKLPRSVSLDEMLKAIERVERGHARLQLYSNKILVESGKPGG